MRIRRRLLPKPLSRGPLAIAGFIALPLFFSSLMASTLAQEKPHVVQWKGGVHGILTTWHDPTTGNVARVWLWAFVPPLLLVLVGWLATRVAFGFYVSCAAAIVLALAVVHKTATWERHHTDRFPWGVDLIPATNAASNKYDPGQWEKMARETSVSLGHWTIVLAVVAAVVMAALSLRRRYGKSKPASLYTEGPGDEGIHAPDSTGASVPVE